jgi:hypothetical protein
MNQHVYTFASGKHAVTISRRPEQPRHAYTVTLSALSASGGVERPLLSCAHEQAHALWELFDAATELVSWLRGGSTFEAWCRQFGLDPEAPRVCAPGFVDGSEGAWVQLRPPRQVG